MHENILNSRMSSSVPPTWKCMSHFFGASETYEPLVGRFCEAHDPYLAYIAYAKGLCDDELIAITNDNSMFKQQAQYLIKRCQPDLVL
jgi:clathrin heavy chain